MERPSRPTPPSDKSFPKVFTAHRRRAFISFRRSRDGVQFLATLAMFLVGFVALVYSILQWRTPSVPEAPPPAVIEAPVPPEAAPAALPVAPRAAPAPVPVAAPRPAPPAAPAGLDFFTQNVQWSAVVYKDATLTVQRGQFEGEPVLRLVYKVKPNEWAQASTEWAKDLRAFSRLQFLFTDEGEANRLELTLTDADGSTVGRTWTLKSGWTKVDVPFSELGYLFGGDRKMDWGRVTQVGFTVSVKGEGQGGSGRTAIRGLRFY